MSSKVMRIISQASKLSKRNMSAGGAEAARPAFYKLKDIQKRFTQDDGLPVHLKAGTKDQILYKGSWALVIFTDLWGLKVIIWDASIAKFLATF